MTVSAALESTATDRRLQQLSLPLPGDSDCIGCHGKDFANCIAEFIGTFALIFVGIGAIKTAGHDVLGVALAHGLTIARVRVRDAAYFRRTTESGGHVWPALRRSHEVHQRDSVLDRAMSRCHLRRVHLPRPV